MNSFDAKAAFTRGGASYEIFRLRRRRWHPKAWSVAGSALSTR
jgi:hypothetical protein